MATSKFYLTTVYMTKVSFERLILYHEMVARLKFSKMVVMAFCNETLQIKINFNIINITMN